MEPGFSAPQSSAEQAPSLHEYQPGVLPEVAPERETTRHEQAPRHETATTPGATPPIVPTLPQPPQPIAAPVDDGAAPQVVAPSVAADDDLIEKEWVDKAKRIIADTADDPHRREQALGLLQREYLRKRYGKELGAAD